MMIPNTHNRAQILKRIKKLVLTRHINTGSIDYREWVELLEERTPVLLVAGVEGFEEGVKDALRALGSSHTTFYHGQQTSLLPQHTINATLSTCAHNQTESWMFLDVFESGPAEAAGIRPGQLLLAVDGAPVSPPSLPSFGVGQLHRLAVRDKGVVREVLAQVPAVKGSRRRPPIVEPKSIAQRMITATTGLLKITYFPGAFGLEFARALDRSIEDLKNRGCKHLVIDLRGNIGGSLGFARLASYLCPDQRPIGRSVTPNRLRSGYDPDILPRVPMPNGNWELLFTLARYAFRDKSVVLLTQALGRQPFHGNTVVLVNEWTNSAAEMVASFAAENRLATLVGTKTAGNVLGAMNFAVGGGYWLRLPVFGWYTSTGKCLEGEGVTPHVSIQIEPEALAEGQDNQLEAAKEILCKQ